MKPTEIKKVVIELSGKESLPTLDQLKEKYGLLDAMSIQAGLVVSAIHARLQLTKSFEENYTENGLVYFEEDQSRFPKS